jgi:hypothetical protein
MASSTPYAMARGSMYVRLDNTRIDLTISQNLEITRFGDDDYKIPYVKVEDAVLWHAEAIDASEGSRGNLLLKADFEKALAKFKAEKLRLPEGK